MRLTRRSTFLAALAAMLALGASTRNAAQTSSSSRGPAPAASVRLYVFDGGTLESDPARYQLTKEEVGVTEFAVAAYLIVHPKGLLMWDAGAVPDEEWKPTGSPVRQRLVLADGQERFVTLARPLATQLRATGHAPGEITHLALSHYHWDHTANANAFAGATWLVRQAERDAMFAEKVAGANRAATYAALRKSRTTIITADDHDVFGDGRVVLKAAPGHTPGHQVLYLKLAETGDVVLSGDLYHYPQERTLGRLPTFEANQDQTRASRASLDAFLAKTKARLWIQHDFTAHAKLKKAPEYYQ
ncbi:MAG TPA: N-acyl homoserine lactonase family protein [Vicinamibacterales bacterium]|nr:N-acyl homoserine lactonase family protein [Vicinamibacterales bacterium]